jgi:hypothetical protein
MTYRVTGDVLAPVCSTCGLTRCPCGMSERVVAFVRGVCAVPTARARRSLFGPHARPGAGRHRRRPMFGGPTR